MKWIVELSEFDIEYHQISDVKGQVLINFIVELSDVQPRYLSETLWILETNDSSRVVGGGASMVLQSSEGLSITQAVKFALVASNNEAKYEVVLLELPLAKKLLVANLEFRCYSQLVESQLRGEYEAKKRRLKQYLKLAQSLMVVSHPVSWFDPIGRSEPSSGCETIYCDSLPDFFF